MQIITRRKFLQLTTGTLATGLAAPLLSFEDIANAAISRPLAANTPILVVVSLYGGNDGLNTVIPYTDSIYFSSRPGLTYPVGQVIPLDAEFALNPSMTGIKTLWDQNKVAIIRGVGYPKPDYSHFASMAKWQTGAPNNNLNSALL